MQTMKLKDVKDDVLTRPPLFILSASLFEVDGTPSFSVMKSFTRESLETMTVADITRMFVEELMPEGIKFICGYNHSIIRYGDDVETEVLFEEKGNSAQKAIVHHVSLSLPLEDACFNGAAGFLHPKDPVLNYFCLAQRSGNIIPVCIFKDGLKYKKAESRTTVRIKDIKDEEVVECEDSIDYDNYVGARRFGHYEENSVIVSHEEYDDLSDPSFSYRRSAPIAYKKRACYNRKDSETYPPNLPQVKPPAVLLVPKTIDTRPNVVHWPSHDNTEKKKDNKTLIPSPSPMKRRRKAPVSYKC